MFLEFDCVPQRCALNQWWAERDMDIFLEMNAIIDHFIHLIGLS